ncbi:GTP cyclohydrolase II [Tilletia horrida]|nr:GTP cyclohydrolase II [Tilletia horrida]
MTSTSANHGHSHHHHHHHNHPPPIRYPLPTQADEDLLDLLTSSSFSPSLQHHHNHAASPIPALSSASASASSPLSRRPLSTLAALRRPPIDPIVLAATLSSGPHVTRHHFHHSFDGQAPDSSRSQQMPASVRKAKLREQQQQGAAKDAPSQDQPPMTHAQDQSSLEPSTAQASEERPSYVSKQAPRSVRLAREATDSNKPQTQSVAPALPPIAVSPQPERHDASSSMRRNPAPFPPPPLIVRCYARTRIPTPHGEVFAYIYKNNRDLKEHLALVVDPAQNDEIASAWYRSRASQGGKHTGTARVRPRRAEIRSRTLDELWAADETDMERIVRGAYVGRLSGDYQIASAPPSAPSARVEDDAEDEDSEELEPPLVRIHSECYTGETIGSQRCDCGEQLDEAIRLIALEDEITHPPYVRASSTSRYRHSHHSHHHHSESKSLLALPNDRISAVRMEDSIHSLGGGRTGSVFGITTNPHTPMLTGAPPSPTLPPHSPSLTDSVVGMQPPAKPRRARGIVVYLRQEGRGIGLLDKLMAYNLQDMGHDTVSANILLGHKADARTYDIAAAILRDLGCEDSVVAGSGKKGIRLLTNNPEKVEGMEREGVRVVERVPMVPRMWKTREGRRKSRRTEEKRRKKKRHAKSKSKTKVDEEGKSSRKSKREGKSSKEGRRTGDQAEEEKGGAHTTFSSSKKRAPALASSNSASHLHPSPGSDRGQVYRPSLLGIHSRILSQSSMFADSDADADISEDHLEDADEDVPHTDEGADGGALSQAEEGQRSQEQPKRRSRRSHKQPKPQSQPMSPSISLELVGAGSGAEADHEGRPNGGVAFENGTDAEDQHDLHDLDDRDDEEGYESSAAESAGSHSSSESYLSSSSGYSSSSSSGDSYTAHVARRSGATMIGADVTRSAELERYLRTKVERMGHMLDLPSASSSADRRGDGGGAGPQGGSAAV